MFNKIVKKIQFCLIFFFYKNFYLINSPLQFINLIELLNKSSRLSKKTPTLIGYASSNTLKQIKALNKIYLNSKNIYFLGEILSVKSFHILLWIRKKIINFEQCVVGDYNYYLFKEFYKHSKKIILIDDGLSTLTLIKNFNFKKKINVFTVYKNIESKEHIHILENNFQLLRSKKNNFRLSKNKVYIIGSASVERDSIEIKEFYRIIRSILSKNKNKEVYYVPHRLELLHNKLKIFKKLKIKKLNLPIEVALIRGKILPKKIIGFHTSALFNLQIIFKNKIILQNIDYNFEGIINQTVKNTHLIANKYYKLQKIKNIKF